MPQEARFGDGGRAETEEKAKTAKTAEKAEGGKRVEDSGGKRVEPTRTKWKMTEKDDEVLPIAR